MEIPTQQAWGRVVAFLLRKKKFSKWSDVLPKLETTAVNNMSTAHKYLLKYE